MFILNTHPNSDDFNSNDSSETSIRSVVKAIPKVLFN